MYIPIINCLFSKNMHIKKGGRNMEWDYQQIRSGRGFIRRNWHRFDKTAWTVNRIYYILGGTAWYQGRVQLLPGFVYIFRADPAFALEQDPVDPVDLLWFDFITTQPLLSEPYLALNPAPIPALPGILQAAADEFRWGSVPIGISLAYFRLLCYHLEPFWGKPPRIRPLTASAIAAIRRMNPQQVSVSAVAEELNVNVNHLIRCFRQDMALTPHRYIAHLKIDAAKNWLDSGCTAAAVAEWLGFASPAAFSTFFKNATGVSPSQYRARR